MAGCSHSALPVSTHFWGIFLAHPSASEPARRQPVSASPSPAKRNETQPAIRLSPVLLHLPTHATHLNVNRNSHQSSPSPARDHATTSLPPTIIIDTFLFLFLLPPIAVCLCASSTRFLDNFYSPFRHRRRPHTILVSSIASSTVRGWPSQCRHSS